MRTLEQARIQEHNTHTEGLRLPATAIETIRNTIREVFPSQAQIILFGSRTRPEARGGDLDILVIARAAREILARARIRAIALLQLALGDQHIDLVVTSDPENDSRRVVREAIRTGIGL